ncbi:MAG TPA: EamA family transporter [Acidimicrobiia bacterium]|jgi:drug/metabolite transporter (DMT)-like permease
MSGSNRSGVLLTVLAASLFAVAGVVAADLFKVMEPAKVAQLRSVGAALICIVIALIRRQGGHRGQLWKLATLGGLIALVTVCYYIAIDRLGVGPGVTIEFTAPILVLAYTAVIQRRHVPLGAWVAAGVALAGVSLITKVWEAESLDPVGLAAGAAAAVTFAAYLLLTSHLGQRLPSLTIAAYGLGFSALLYLAFAGPPTLPTSTRIWLELAWVIVLGTVVPFFLEILALRRTSPGVVGVAASIEPVVAALVAWLWLDQSVTAGQAVGIGLVVIGVAVIQLRTAPSAPNLPA